MHTPPTLFLVDAHALLFKYYYAFMGRPMRNRDGMNTSVVFGFVKFLRDIRKREEPDLLGVAFDPKGGSFRRLLYTEYKANRLATPEDIIASVPYVKRLLEAMRIPIFEVQGYEADDVIGTLAHQGAAAGYDVYMVTPDKDYGQLVTDNCKIYKQKGADDIEIVDREAIRAKYGIDDPALVCDILALWGDASDNIPGVPGIGEKGAAKLVGRWGGVESILDHLDEIGGKQGAAIAGWRDNLLLAKKLTRICLDVPVRLDTKALQTREPNVEALRELYAELDFKSLAADLSSRMATPAPATTPTTATAAVATPPQPEPQAKAEPRPKARHAALAGQGDLFSQGLFDSPAPATATEEAPAASSAAEPAAPATETLSEAPADEGIGYHTVADIPHTYTLVETPEALRPVVDKLRQAKVLAFDTETTGLDPFNCRIVGISLAAEPHEAYYVTIHETNAAAMTAVLKPLFAADRIDKIGQNMKFDLLMLRTLGIEVRGRKFDTMIVHYLLDPESRHNMNYLAIKYLNYQPIEIESLIGRGSKQLTMDMVAPERIAEYAAEDADVTLQLYHALWPKLAETGLTQLYADIEEPMIEVLADIETAGVKIDTEALAAYGVELRERLTELEQAVRTEADEPTLNINSPRQLGEVLFGKMKIAEKPKKTRTHQYCTDEEYLQGFAHRHRIVDMILEYRGVKKLLSTYIEALPLLVNPRTGRIHTSFNQAVTATGRLSSTNPNLQNIPVRDALGRRIRQAFVPSDSDHVLLSADYSQVELRLMAHLSGDKALLSAFARGEDIHTATAALLYHKTSAEVTSEERRRAKTANFGIIYGISAFGLSQRLEIPRKEAKELIDGYFASYPQVKEYMEQVVVRAREQGYVETIFGRRRYLNDICSQNAVARGLAERNAINAPIQGSAADIMKIAMIEVHRRFRAAGLRSRVILQVHDELVVDTLRSEKHLVEKMLTDAMEHAARLKVRLLVECGEGENWLAAH